MPKIKLLAYLEPDQVNDLKNIKDKTKVPVAELIRIAVDKLLNEADRVENYTDLWN